jgi:hypothetical protein
MKIILITLFIFPYFLCAQQLFNQIYLETNTENALFGATNLVVFDNNFYVLGQKVTTTERSIFVLKIHSDGTLISNYEYLEADKIFYTTKIIRREDDFLIFGSKVEIPDNSTTSNVFLASFNNDFELNWIKTYGGSLYDSGRDLLQNEDGTLLLCGSKSNTANNEDFYLIKTDAEGNILWEKTYGGSGEDVANSIIHAHDGGYLISGTSNSFSSTNDILVYKIDEFGNAKWEKTFGSTLPVFAGIGVSLSDKCYLFHKSIENDFSSFTASIVKINENGEVVWTKDYPETNSSSFSLSKPISMIDGSIILAGHVRSSLDNPVGRIIKTDPFGNILWNRKYFVRADRSQYIYNIQTTSDGGFVFCGSAFDSTNTQRAWVAKLDCFGCDGVLCDFGDSLCQTYDCTTKDFEADFISTTLSIDLQNNQEVVFTNNATQCTNREWILPDTTIYTTNSVSYTFTETGTYPVQLITYHGVCSDTSTVEIEVFNSASLNELVSSKLALKIIPNPSSGSFFIKTNEDIENIILIDLFGKEQNFSYLAQKTNEYLLETNVSAGTYLLKIKTKNVETIKKITVLD